jgi:hypothetical protein
MKKLFAYFVAFGIALLCAATILSPAIAGAEEFLGITLSPAGSKAEKAESKWQRAVVDSSTKVEYDGEIAYLIEFTTNSGEVMSYYDDNNLPKGTELEVFIDNDEVINSVTKQEEEIQAWIIYGALGFLGICIIWSIVTGTF